MRCGRDWCWYGPLWSRAEPAADLSLEHGIEAEVLAGDPTDEPDLAMVERRLANLDQPVGMPVNNAGYVCYGRVDLVTVRPESGSTKQVGGACRIPCDSHAGSLGLNCSTSAKATLEKRLLRLNSTAREPLPAATDRPAISGSFFVGRVGGE